MIANGFPSAIRHSTVCSVFERTEPELGRRLFRSGLAIAADRYHLAQIVFGDQDHQAGLAGTNPHGAAVKLAGLADGAAIPGRNGGINAADCLGVCLAKTGDEQHRGGPSACDACHCEAHSCGTSLHQTCSFWGRFEAGCAKYLTAARNHPRRAASQTTSPSRNVSVRSISHVLDIFA
jgi:hypothetical protein